MSTNSGNGNATHPYGLTPEQISQQYNETARDVQSHSNKSRQRLASASVGGKQLQHATQNKQQQYPATTKPAIGNRAQQQPDSLEYFIKFPSPTTATLSGAESDFVFVDNERNIPIIMLLGWAGCQDRYLMKYSKIYEDRGLITVRYTAPVDTLFWKRTEMIPIGEKILKLIQDMNFDAHPLIFHIFSNGGAFLYQHISLAAHKHKSPLQVRGVIFDSAPGERRMLGLYRAISAIYGRDKRKCNCLAAIVITLTLSMMWFVEEAFNAFKSLFVKSERLQSSPFSELKNEANTSPQLFLYSKGDVVIPYQDVEKFMNIRRNQGVNVSSVCFDDAEHVKIFTKYPTQYIKCVCNFINSCMSLPARYRVANEPEHDFNSTPSPEASSNELKYD